MFEAFGWACVRDGSLPQLRDRVAELERSGFTRVTLVDQLNWSGTCLTVMASYNHRQEEVIDLFRWLAANAPGSYGLLHVLDDEDRQFDNEFRVWCLRRGELVEQSDPHLSPFIPTWRDESCHC